MDPWIVGGAFNVRFRQLHELAENKLVTVAEMFSLGWGVGVRYGSGKGDCWLERKIWWGSVVNC